MFMKAMIAVAIAGAFSAGGAAAYHQFGCPMQYFNCCHSARESASPESTTPVGENGSSGSGCCKKFRESGTE